MFDGTFSSRHVCNYYLCKSEEKVCVLHGRVCIIHFHCNSILSYDIKILINWHFLAKNLSNVEEVLF